MKHDDLKQLRIRRIKEFTSIDEMLAFAKDFFKVKNVYHNVPKMSLVAGHSSFGPQHWNVHLMDPYTQADETTVKRYLQGLQVLADASKISKYSDVFGNGQVMFNGVDQERESSTYLFSMGVSSKGTDFTLELSKPYQKKSYIANSRLSATSLQTIVSAYVGPK